MVAIVDYGVGNLFSLASSFSFVGQEAVITSSADVIRRADRILLPGVGAFSDAIKKLEESGLIPVIMEECEKGKPLLGICLGMQLLFEKSFEYDEHKGLGLIPGSIRPIANVISPELKIPHIGWNSLKYPNKGRLYEGIAEDSYVYFVHSYYLEAKNHDIVVATTDYGTCIHASVEHDNVFACQFHPEKSSTVGLKILENFLKVSKEDK